jgi:FHA domain
VNTAAQKIYLRYTQLRESGINATDSLNQLREVIVPLPKEGKHELARAIRVLESGEIQPPQNPAVRKVDRPLIKRIQEKKPSEEMVTCAKCGKPNKPQEAICYSCGAFLSNSKQATRALLETDELFFDHEYFGPDSVLSLQARGATDIDLNESYQIRPQDSEGDLVIGRLGDGSTLVPDIDLSEHQADERGVSRLHLTLHYDGRSNTLLVMDMGSANGSFINGQRLHPNEVRILRNGDELRLGKLVTSVTFYRLGWDESIG